MSTDARPAALELLAAAIAAEVAALLRREVDLPTRVDSKSSGSDLVTDVDRAAEALILRRILAARPDDAVVGEEGTAHDGSSGVRWIVDPIDGTTNFVFGHPGFGVSIAAEVDGTVVAGAVADAVHRQVFHASLGGGASVDGRAIRVRPTTELSRALVATGFSYLPDRRRRQAEALMTLLPRIADIRRMGSAAIDLCGVALGRVDAYYELALNEWDLAAGALIAAEAGAVVRRTTVSEPDPDTPGGRRDVALMVAAAPGIAAAFDDLLHEAGVV